MFTEGGATTEVANMSVDVWNFAILSMIYCDLLFLYVHIMLAEDELGFSGEKFH